MEGASMSTNPRTVDEVFKDFKGRRSGMLKALTTDVEEFYRQCDPEKENLCLYGFPDEAWEVNLPAEEVPPELPEPALGINFARDGMQRKDWLSLVAVHSDAWLLAVAFYYGARFDKNERALKRTDLPILEEGHPRLISEKKCFGDIYRKRLFTMINELPTVFDVVTGKKPVKEKPAVNSSGTKAKSATKVQVTQAKPAKPAPPPPKDEEEPLDDEDDEEHGDTFCGSCGGPYTADEFWIGCDICEKWFHGKCVKITPARAEHIKQYKCPSCSNKRART
ncbi:PHD finger protein ALFIN-LIKE 3 isoform X2 [Physcomitrium patens]|uniref:PHD finger protein ALFIN-LIKE 3 isoform X2 n=1 Tax=Physcomitrium patens TaxID=3218 RepID=UPI000D1534F2|nr:PHD finger protein ALFIN-LIKE 3-like isoform X2 [Physcomitrium patens]|eukprot:XP_024380668.1 PHD finger protein ALFIN-LIKE 3-like isoform X2 [Physcomitrella patens]